MMEEPRLQIPQWNKRERSFPVMKEEQPTGSPIRAAACEITCIAYMAAGIFLSLRLDVVERWWQLLLVVCFFVMVGSFFGIMVSAERYEAETEGEERRWKK